MIVLDTKVLSNNFEMATKLLRGGSGSSREVGSAIWLDSGAKFEANDRGLQIKILWAHHVRPTFFCGVEKVLKNFKAGKPCIHIWTFSFLPSRTSS